MPFAPIMEWCNNKILKYKHRYNESGVIFHTEDVDF